MVYEAPWECDSTSGFHCWSLVVKWLNFSSYNPFPIFSRNKGKHEYIKNKRGHEYIFKRQNASIPEFKFTTFLFQEWKVGGKGPYNFPTSLSWSPLVSSDAKHFFTFLKECLCPKKNCRLLYLHLFWVIYLVIKLDFNGQILIKASLIYKYPKTSTINKII